MIDIQMYTVTAWLLALENGEITLFELFLAYAVLARQGVYKPLQVLYGPATWQEERKKLKELFGF